MSAQDRLLTTWGEIAAYLQVSVRTAQNWANGRGLPVQRYGGRVSARTAELDAWVAAETGAARQTGEGPERAPAERTGEAGEPGAARTDEEARGDEPRNAQRRRELKLLLAAGLGLGAVATGVALFRDRKRPLSVSVPVYDLCYDGQHIWATEPQRNRVRKIRLSDRKAVGDYPVSGEGNAFPTHCLFDGTDIWTANRKNGTLGRIRVSDGALMATIRLGWAPYTIGFDGRSIWVANLQGPRIAKIDRSRNLVESEIDLGAEDPCDVAFDGTSLWVALSSAPLLLKLNPETNRVERRILLRTWRASNLHFDGSHMWTTSQEANRVFKLRISDGWPVAHRTVESASGIVRRGEEIWVSQPFADSITRLRRSDAEVLSQHKVARLPLALAATKEEVWVACEGTTSGPVLEIL